jgi:ATP-dependent DNA helicase RecQ
LYNFRRKRAAFRLQHAIRYAENIECRSRMLLAYFGEKNAPDCGICDVCTGRNKAELSNNDFHFFEKKIIQLLDNQPLMTPDLLSNFPIKQHELVRQSLQFLIDEGKVGFDETLHLAIIG